MRRILIVEDEPAIAFGLETDLTQDDYEVEVVADGESAVRCGREGDFDLIVLDVMLPKKDGFQVCRELRRAGVRSKVLMLTAKSQELEKVMGLDLAEVSTGGASEASFASALGIPTLDGLGADGDGAHAEDEHVLVSSMPERALLAAGLIERLAGA